MLEVRGLTIRMDGRALIRDLSITVPATGITALIGASGCGKTSVLKWLSGILPISFRAEGQALLDGVTIGPRQRAFCYQPQSDALFPWLTIAQNVTLGLQIEGLSRREALARVAPLFAPFGLGGTETLYPSQLSGGMRQRAAFLRTIVQDSRFVLLDEPFSALDAVTRLRMQDWLLARLAERARAVLLVTHDLHEATGMADRILVMAPGPGRIIADIPVTTPRHARSEANMATLRDTLKTLLLKDTHQ
jgi:ABC-type nitrate/sulfonate/bicarbonate transport system ATPase subunit